MKCPDCGSKLHKSCCGNDKHAAEVLPIARWKEAGQLAYEKLQDDFPANTINTNMIILMVTDNLPNYLTEDEQKVWHSKMCWAEQKRFVVNNVL